jgi:hypothetical protein
MNIRTVSPEFPCKLNAADCGYTSRDPKNNGLSIERF